MCSAWCTRNLADLDFPLGTEKFWRDARNASATKRVCVRTVEKAMRRAEARSASRRQPIKRLGLCLKFKYLPSRICCLFYIAEGSSADQPIPRWLFLRFRVHTNAHIPSPSCLQLQAYHLRNVFSTVKVSPLSLRFSLSHISQFPRGNKN